MCTRTQRGRLRRRPPSTYIYTINMSLNYLVWGKVLRYEKTPISLKGNGRSFLPDTRPGKELFRDDGYRILAEVDRVQCSGS